MSGAGQRWEITLIERFVPISRLLKKATVEFELHHVELRATSVFQAVHCSDGDNVRLRVEHGAGLATASDIEKNLLHYF